MLGGRGTGADWDTWDIAQVDPVHVSADLLGAEQRWAMRSGRLPAGNDPNSADECVENGNVCRDRGQTCTDPDMAPSSIGDWTCDCVMPATGTARAGAADCTWLGECIAQSSICNVAGQTCNDPNLDTPGDWQCVCIPPYERTVATMQPAVCSLDECRKNEDVCWAAGQMCDDPNKDPRSLGDWVCEAVPPASGRAVATAAVVVYKGECVERSHSCTAYGQACMDPDTTTPDDWWCVCPPPQEGKKRGGPAACSLDECDIHWMTCYAVGQICQDIMPTPSSRGDWTCNCVPPATGTARGGVAGCGFLGECQATSDVCTAAGAGIETCVDQLGDNNWQCRCVPPAAGFATGKAAAACVLDECAQFGHVCAAQDQACVDPDTSAAGLSNWQCRCTGGRTVGAAIGQPAQCVLDECLIFNRTCLSMGQVCLDPDKSPASRDDWTCHCMGSATGSAVAQAALCNYEGQCQSEFRLCTSRGQTCSDPDTSLDSDSWQCECVYPYTGSTSCTSTNCVPGECTFDECVVFGIVCTQLGQTCYDPDTKPSSTGDWQCECGGSGVGTQTGGPAACAWSGECRERQVTCASAGQTCLDPDPTVLGDWSCRCAWPQTGERTGGRAECILDECVQFNGVCTTAGQVCVDPLPHLPERTNNWMCRCSGGTSRGTMLMAPALCTFDECSEQEGVCRAGGQRCFDPNKDPWARGDWTCQCIPPAVGAGTRSLAVCLHSGECSGNAVVCEGAGQSCRPLPSDWECVCIPPMTGRQRRGTATCDFDECFTHRHKCNDVGQECVDLNADPGSLGDWVCRCLPAVGQRAVAPADCTHSGECASYGASCAAHGQSCNDPDTSTEYDWRCECVRPQRGQQRGGAANCTLDECELFDSFCTEVGQMCVDPDPRPTQLDDWQCHCPGASCTGSARYGPAVCDCIGECAGQRANAHICEAAAQFCHDPDTQVKGDWECRCVPPMDGSARGGPAGCTIRGPKEKLARQRMGQADWLLELWLIRDFCKCSLGDLCKLSYCTLDECGERRKVCAASGQACVDPNTSPSSRADWYCECIGSAEGRAVGAPAECQWYGDCTQEGGGDNRRAPRQMDAGAVLTNRRRVLWQETRGGSYTQTIVVSHADDDMHGSVSMGGDQRLTTWGRGFRGADPPPWKPRGAGLMRTYPQLCRDTGLSRLRRLAEPVRDLSNPQRIAPDWECVCVPPLTGRASLGPAACVRDECVEFGEVCAADAQTCADADDAAAARGDWSCTEERLTCPTAAGAAVGAAAQCAYEGECTARIATCLEARQTCADPDPARPDDWECACVAPSVGREESLSLKDFPSLVGGHATCVLDECVRNGIVCTSMGQICVDPFPLVSRRDDWVCECVGSDVRGRETETGRGFQRAAVCELDECFAGAGEVCWRRGQRCIDTDTNPAAVGDWTCVCAGSGGSGTVVEGESECAYTGECATHWTQCVDAGQACVDPDTTRDGDWRCECVPPFSGQPRVGAIADCRRDECMIHRAVCEGVGQRCVDPDTASNSIGDWRCDCAAPLQGSQRGAAAACGYAGECAHAGVACEIAGQLCADPDPNKAGDWTCLCVAPQTPADPQVPHGMQGPASCAVDECVLHRGTCEVAGQTCVDHDTDPRSTGNWRCECVPPARGSAVALAAVCEHVGECARFAPICYAAGQACNDPDASRPDTWECVCVPPAVGRGQGGPTVCVLDECIHNAHVCSAVGQRCTDPDRSTESRDDWMCNCLGSGAGNAVGEAAQCTY
eukprot:gene57205-biopygen118847